MIVADAPLLVSLLTDGGPTGQAARRTFAESATVCVPRLRIFGDAGPSAQARWFRGLLLTDRCRAAIKDLNDLPLASFPTRPLIRRAFELWAHVTTHDACYVALAEALQCDLVTGDQRLVDAIGPRCGIRAVGQIAAEVPPEK